MARAPTHEAEVSTAEWALLRECACPTPNCRRGVEWFRPTVDWEAFCRLADEHAVLGLVARQLLDHDDVTKIPLDAVRFLRTWQRNHALFTLNLAAEMYRLLSSFRDDAIEALVTKGPVLSARCYGDPGLRQYGDLDLVVRDRDVLRVTELMISLGYQATIPVSAIQANKTPGEYKFRQKNSQLLVEFHTERTFRYHPKPLSLEKLFQRQSLVECDGHLVPALAPEDELVLICIHGAKHFWERLSYIADVAAFVSEQHLDWAKIRCSAMEVRAKRMLHLGLFLAREMLGASLPAHVGALIASDSAVPKLAAQITRWLPAAGSATPGIVNRASFRARMHGRALGGLAYLLRLSFSPTEEDWLRGGDESRPWLLDALGRPFRLARKYAGKL